MRERFQFLDWLRCIGVLLIVYDHLGPLRNSEWFVSGILEKIINKPLGIVQYFGAFGVCLFFIISGFCLTANADTGKQFVYNKVVRILVTLSVATLMFWIFNKIISILAGQTYWDQFAFKEWGESATLLCYIFGRDSAINGAIWYLFPLMAVFLIVGIFYKIIKKNMVYLVGILDLGFILVIAVTKHKGYYIVQMQWLIFMLVPLFGVLIRSIWESRISFKLFLAAFVMNYIIFLKSILVFRPEYYLEQPYLISLVYALLFFSIFLLTENKIAVPQIVKFISNISFSLYLLHMTFGSLIITGLENKYGFTISFTVTLACVVALSRFFNKEIEQNVIMKLKIRSKKK